ncbi:hypothetical protein REPUB_Repub11eG0161000 [Reevesia pubescens]
MASISKLCLYKTFSLSFAWSVKDQSLLQRCSFPVTCVSSEQILLKNDCLVFAQMPERIGVSTYYHETRMEENGLARYVLDSSHLISVLKFCGGNGCLELGRSYHALIAKIGLDGDEFVGASLIDMYAKCGDMDSAVVIFNRMPRLDVASCNCLISGYASCGLFDEAFRFFMKYDSFGNKPNPYTYSTMLAICGTLSAIEEGKQLHAQVVKMQYLSETAVSNAILTMYSKCGVMKDAESLFKRLPQRNIISWTAIINGFYQHEDFEKAMRLFCLMRESGIEPNEYTFTIALAYCGSMKNLDNSRLLHSLVIKKGMALGEFVGTAIIGMYSKLGEMDDAKKQFKGMGIVASKVSWNALTKGLVQNDKADEALDAFCEMVRKDVACDVFTFSIILKACASLPSFTSCQQIHARIVKANFETNTHVGSSLIETYTKCGSVGDAERVFSRISAPDVASWNSVIKAYSQNGNPRRAISLFRRMIDKGFRPTGSTFLAILSACSHSGKIQDGQEIFQSMVREFGILPEEAHYSCMVDLLGRSGQLEKALDFINNLPIKPTASIWKPLLAACRCHNNFQMAEFVAKHILAMDPKDATVYVTLSNMYAEAGQLVNAENQRKLMKLKEVTKEPGCSWIEVNKKMHKFFSRDRTHPESAKIYNMLKQVMMQIKGTAYTTNPIPLQPKEDSCLYHSEKLTVCFGLISLPAGKPVRIFKNLRVCNDCHMFMKFASMITDRVIVLSDNYRFHHFNKVHPSQSAIIKIKRLISIRFCISRDGSDFMSKLSTAKHFSGTHSGNIPIMHRSFQSSTDAYANLIETYTRDRALKSGRLLHAHLIINGLARLTYLASKFVTFYTECGQMSDARKLFDKIPKTNLHGWISIIGACSRRGYYREAINFFSEMHAEGLGINKYVIPSILKACGHVLDQETGKKIHCLCLKKSFESDAFVISSLIDMYSKCGKVEKAKKVFDRMFEKDLVALNAIVSGYAQNGLVEKGLRLVEEMKLMGVKPDVVTWNTLIAGFSKKGDYLMVSKVFELMLANGIEPDVSGKEVHGYAVVIGVVDDIYVKSALVDMYAKCGFISEARTLFYKMSEKSTVTWNSMIFGYANHGYCEEAIQLFKQMQGKKPDHLTFTAVLTACSHAGLVELGKCIFNLMQEKYKITPRLEHYACLVDLVGRAGKLDEAYDIIKTMSIEPDLFVWGALLGACRTHGNIDLAEVAAKHLRELEPVSPGNNLLLANLYADAGSWGNVARLKKMMKKRKLRKFLGRSWIEGS